jgi:uncharacterized Zn finger protein
MLQQTPLETLLASLDRDQLLALLAYLVEQQPELADLIRARVAVLHQAPATPRANAPRLREEQPPLSPAPFRKQVRAALSGLHRRGSYDYGMAAAIVNEIGGVAEEARPYVDAGDGRNALVILGAVAEEYLDAVEELDDSDGEVSALCDDLGRLLTEALLSADLKPQAQQEWAQRIEGWQRKGADYGMEDSFEAARYAAMQGWSYPPLGRVLRGEITERGAWEGEAPACAGALAQARLNVLQRQGRTQEYLYLAQAERQTERYVTMLVRLGRIAEAVDYGLKCSMIRGMNAASRVSAIRCFAQTVRKDTASRLANTPLGP